MAPTILIVGATGNTGKSVVRNLPSLLKSKYRILGLTRSLNNPISQELARIPDVEMQEKDWTTIDAAWLKEQQVARIFIAPHNLPHQFVDESAFYLAALEAGIEYVVKISTAVKFVGPTNPVFYGRSHWAIETLLSQPEFKKMKWTSLQPNIFTASHLPSSVEWIKNYQKTGNQEILKLTAAADVPIAFINPDDIGNITARLLAIEDPTPYNQARYAISGPQDVTGKQIVEAVEQIAGTKVHDVVYKDRHILDQLEATGDYPVKVLSSILDGMTMSWNGLFSLAESPTSKEIIEIAAPKSTIADALKKMLAE